MKQSEHDGRSEVAEFTQYDPEFAFDKSTILKFVKPQNGSQYPFRRKMKPSGVAGGGCGGGKSAGGIGGLTIGGGGGGRGGGVGL